MIDIPTHWEPRTNKHPTGVFVTPPAAWPCCSSPVPSTTKKSPDRKVWGLWWSIVHSTRTQHLFTGDGFGIVREVEIEHDPVVKNVDRVDKGINDLPLVFHILLKQHESSPSHYCHLYEAAATGCRIFRGFDSFFHPVWIVGFLADENLFHLLRLPK